MHKAKVILGIIETQFFAAKLSSKHSRNLPGHMHTLRSLPYGTVDFFGHLAHTGRQVYKEMSRTYCKWEVVDSLLYADPPCRRDAICSAHGHKKSTSN